MIDHVTRVQQAYDIREFFFLVGGVGERGLGVGGVGQFFRARSFYSQLKRAVEPRKIFIMPGHYKKILPAQQPIRARVLS